MGSHTWTTMAQQELVSALFDRWAGKPILVIGGGPSVLTDQQMNPACVISANDHGAHQSRYKVDLWMNMDCNDCMTLPHVSMEGRMCAPGRVIVNRFAWADYRLGDFTYSGNTGLSAIVLAAALGGNPVITTGIDCWAGGRHYFHGKKLSTGPSYGALGRMRKKDLRKLVEAVKGVDVLPLSGALKLVFPTVLQGGWKPTAYRKHLLSQPTKRVHVHREFSLVGTDRAKVGSSLALTPKEAQKTESFAT